MPEYVTDHFTVEELQCPDSGIIQLCYGFDDELEALRTAYGEPMFINSACRDPEYNRRIGGHYRSLHMFENEYHGTDTCAVDIIRPAGPELARLVKHALNLNWSVGIANTFIHLDQRTKYAGLKQRIYSY